MKIDLSDGWRLLTLRELQLLQLGVMKDIHRVCVANGINYYLIAGSLLGAVRHGGFIPWDDDIDIGMMRKDYKRFRKLFPVAFDTQKYFLQDYRTDIDFQPSLMRLCIRNTYQDVPSESHLRNCKNSYIDIFPLDNVPDEERLRAKQEQKLARLRYIIDRKLYRIYPQNSTLVRFIKRACAVTLSFVPLSCLHRREEAEMVKYDATETAAVASMASKYGYRKQIMPRGYYGRPKLVAFEGTEFYAPEMRVEYLQHLYGKNYMQLPPKEKRVLPHDVYQKC